jgi:hypothetical protein
MSFRTVHQSLVEASAKAERERIEMDAIFGKPLPKRKPLFAETRAASAAVAFALLFAVLFLLWIVPQAPTP